ncbi:unnamed protein product [Rotaria sordida]|uniref:STIM1/2 Orai1-activating region domain-containing protein n=1 Tax=Rotaria sordida TaxID=392033 RepID=A0A818PET6_9BILA|nr:unnamed protein product [Rotaria sordida]CAF0807420.1 unnamed protein product [Rotaria sordida]CAF3521176.1 unnamed protein product [Rotaria sordida]CAF3623673.1 unnamed protein product [Rotaria sordida]
MKDIILISTLFVSVGVCIHPFIRQRQTQENMNIMLQELEILQKAKGNLLAEQVDGFRKHRESIIDHEKQISFDLEEIEQKGFSDAVRMGHTNCIDNADELVHATKERLIEIHDEYEEREQRWNRIVILLNRDDLNDLGLSTSVICRTKDSPSVHA